jgi:hypothetical protein
MSLPAFKAKAFMLAGSPASNLAAMRPPLLSSSSGLPSRLLKVVCACLLVAVLLCGAPYLPAPVPHTLDIRAGLDVPLGWRPFLYRHPAGPLPEITSSLAQRVFSDACADDWIATGEVCADLAGRLGDATQRSQDIIITYVNGSLPLLRLWRDWLSTSTDARASSLDLDTASMPLSGVGENHFREHQVRSGHC